MYDDDARIPAAPPRRKREWRRALRALRALMANPNDTKQAFEIFDAIDADACERAFRRFHADPTGRRLLAARPSLPDHLADRPALAHMAPGSFGRAFLAYLDETGFDPRGLLQLKADLEADLRTRGEVRPPLDPAREWFRDRGLYTHDLMHVLTGYGTDELGEATLLPFTWAQNGGHANAILVIGVALRGISVVGPRFLRYLWQAWHRGRRTPWLGVLPYEELLPLPLAEVRRIAGVVPAETAHPGGILRGSWSAGGGFVVRPAAV
jgi:ubiquinone biosynthesis protein COQ4